MKCTSKTIIYNLCKAHLVNWNTMNLMYLDPIEADYVFAVL